MREILIVNIKELKSDIETAEKECKKSPINSTEYAYWNGVRCQGEVTLKRFEKCFESNDKFYLNAEHHSVHQDGKFFVLSIYSKVESFFVCVCVMY